MTDMWEKVGREKIHLRLGKRFSKKNAKRVRQEKKENRVGGCPDGRDKRCGLLNKAKSSNNGGNGAYSNVMVLT